MLKINILQTNIETDSFDQLQTKLKRYTKEIETLRHQGIGKSNKKKHIFPKNFLFFIGTDKLKEELYDSLYTSRYIPIEDRKNKPFYDLLVHLYGVNQVTELSTICTKDVLQSKFERDQANEIRIRDVKIEELNRMNRDLQAEIDRLKAVTTSNEQPTGKPTKPQWRPVPAAGVTREKKPTRQTLKPMSVQFGSKPGSN
jgi:hypothetical protein